MPAPVEPRGRATLPPLPADRARGVLAAPRLPAASVADVALARDAARLNLAVRLDMPVAAGRTLVARALHAHADRSGPLLAVDGRARGLDGLPAGATLLVDATTLTAPAAAALEAALDDGGAWVLVATAPGDRLPPALIPRLGAVTLHVPALRDRQAELPALAAHLLAGFAARAGLPTPRLAADALAHLAAQPWAGDIAELDATLARAFLRAGGDGITATHLADPLAGRAGSPARPDHQLEYLVAQLAHELRNPLATVKTFGQLPGLGDDPELRARFLALTDDAIARMDSLLETASAFAGLGAPVPGTIELGPLLDGLVASARPDAAARAIALDYASPNGARCTADAHQLGYALRTLLEGVVREAPANDAVRVDAATPGRIRIAYDPRGGTAERLRRIVTSDGDPDGGEAPPLPLGLLLARAVLERNGGALEVAPQADGRAVVEVRLPAVRGEGGG